MSRALILATLLATLLMACGTQQPAPVVTVEPPESAAEAVQRWLLLHREVADITPEEAVQALVEVDRPEGEEALYYYALLNQQLEAYGAWVQARDAFNTLEKSEVLFEEQRELASIMRQYNQNRINAYQRVRELVQQSARLQHKLRDTEEERAGLEMKIQALTDLETDISTRREE